MVSNNAGVLLTPVTCIYEALHLGGVPVAFSIAGLGAGFAPFLN
jgi:hypothetical protein